MGWSLLFLISFCYGLFESDKLIPNPAPLAASELLFLKTLPAKCMEKRFYATASVVCHRMLILSGDPEISTVALQGLIDLVDAGFPEEIVSWIAKSDLTEVPAVEVVNERKGSLQDQLTLYRFVYFTFQSNAHWASFYGAGLLLKSFDKLLFYDALRLFGKKQWDASVLKLKELLKKMTGEENPFFVKKVARTLARTYFEQKKYADAYDVYAHFLLKTAVQDPMDWLEATWCLFYQKQYAQALGMLYNFETGSHLAPQGVAQPEMLEIFVLKSLIYQKLCSQDGIQQLEGVFKKRFGAVLEGIKKGASLKNFPELTSFYEPRYELIRHFLVMHDRLKEELGRLQKEKGFHKNELALLQRFIASEMAYLSEAGGFLQEKRFQAIAEQLVLMEENLKFMQFDVLRARFNPDDVFSANLQKLVPLVTAPPVEHVRLWPQTGSFWLQERLSYQSGLQSQCRPSL